MYLDVFPKIIPGMQIRKWEAAVFRDVNASKHHHAALRGILSESNIVIC